MKLIPVSLPQPSAHSMSAAKTGKKSSAFGVGRYGARPPGGCDGSRTSRPLAMKRCSFSDSVALEIRPSVARSSLKVRTPSSALPSRAVDQPSPSRAVASIVGRAASRTIRLLRVELSSRLRSSEIVVQTSRGVTPMALQEPHPNAGSTDLPHLAATGYAEMFQRAGFARQVELARSRPHPRELLAAIPEELIESVALTGRGAAARADEYRDAGVDDLIIVPACTDDDPAGGGLLSELAQTIR